jgi:hypothetical protein
MNSIHLSMAGAAPVTPPNNVPEAATIAKLSRNTTATLTANHGVNPSSGPQMLIPGAFFSAPRTVYSQFPDTLGASTLTV